MIVIPEFYKKHRSLLEFSLRIYIAYYLADYGLAKLTGNMFNNATPEILRTELQRVDLFHLTWYFFYKSTVLSYAVGICQIASAILLLFSRTVLLGCAIALPILINIFLIDIAAFPDHVLATRVFLYILCILLFAAYRRKPIKEALASLCKDMPGLSVTKQAYYLFVPMALALFILLEIIICKVLERFF